MTRDADVGAPTAWARIDGRTATVGVDAESLRALGTVTHVDVIALGTPLAVGSPCCGLETAKVVADLLSPVRGRVSAVNELVVERPELLQPEDAQVHWLLRIAIEHDVLEQDDS